MAGSMDAAATDSCGARAARRSRVKPPMNASAATGIVPRSRCLTRRVYNSTQNEPRRSMVDGSRPKLLAGSQQRAENEQRAERDANARPDAERDRVAGSIMNCDAPHLRDRDFDRLFRH